MRGRSQWSIQHYLALFGSALFGITVGLGASVYASRDGDPEQARLPLEDLRLFTEVVNRVKTAYVDEIDDATIFEYAIEGILSGLDPHSAYLKPEAFRDLQINTSGEFGGLGIEVGMENGFVKVVSPIDDTPADRAGVQAGDLIIQLDDKAVKGMSLMEAVNIMRGKPGTPIILTIVREGEAEPLKIRIVRDVITVRSVKSRTLEPGYGYVRIAQFQVNTGPDMIKALKEMRKEGDLRGIVLDLRNNPGGVLQAAVDVADAFLSEGEIVYTKGRLPNSEVHYKANSNDTFDKLEIVVLINGGSASASEIVAGALQDHRRALVIGEKSFGKGSVQTVTPLSTRDRALKLTTALYYTPNGRSIQAQGIEPNLVVDRAKLTRVAARVSIKEADLRGHLDNGNGEEGAEKAAEHEKIAKEEQDLALQDYQLFMALAALKARTLLD